jgi:predicted ATPase/DNA-binding SARP family transcriptional activator
MLFRVIGPVAVEHEGRSLPLGGHKQRALLALLLLHANEVVSRDVLIDGLWGGEPPRSALHSLEVYVSRLRKVVGERLQTRPAGYALELGPDELDAWCFEDLLAKGRAALRAGDAPIAEELLRDALELWQGRPFEDVAYESFVQVEAARLEELRLACLEERIEADLALGRHDELVGELEALVAEHPLHERLRKSLMTALYRAGRQAEALEAYRDARRALVDELGIEPSPALQELERLILRQDPALDVPPKRISNTNLPRPVSSFVGRERELAELLARIEGGARLFTLTGPGGSGKTRLALEAAASLVASYKAGVFWVGLAALRDAALVTETISQTLSAEDGLAEHIGEREMLVLVDNLEHVIEAAPELSDLLSACRNLTLLVTSRELLRVAGEVEYPVPPLAEPDAVDLFCERSQLEPTDQIAELCARLDNLPLGIELAAARTKALSPSQILERLSQRLDLLRGGRDADPRQQTLRATIDWSYDLLTAEEQQLFGRLSIFAGGCTLEAAEVVCDADLGSLQSLIEKSLLHFSNERYSMLETIREYAAERLEEPGEEDALCERLGKHLVAVAQAEGAPSFLGRQTAGLARLEQEHPNIRAVVAWAHRARQREPVLALAGMFWLFWIRRGHAEETWGWLKAALTEREDVPAEIWLPALVGGGELARFSGDYAHAAELKEQLLELAGDYEAAEPHWEPGTLADLADIALEQGDLGRARDYAERSAVLRTSRGVSLARALSSLGDIALREGDFDRAEELLQDAARGWSEQGHEGNRAAAVESLGEVARRRGDVVRARELFEQALRSFVALGDGASVGACLQDLALVNVEHGDAQRVGRLWGAGETLRAAGGFRPDRRRAEPHMSEDARALGAAMSMEEAVEYALGEGP